MSTIKHSVRNTRRDVAPDKPTRNQRTRGLPLLWQANGPGFESAANRSRPRHPAVQRERCDEPDYLVRNCLVE
jgi:hypothetical protein